MGFMAVKVPAGTAEIRFNYHTPGLNAGLVITAGSALVLAAYVLLSRKLKKAPTPTRPLWRNPPPPLQKNNPL